MGFSRSIVAASLMMRIMCDIHEQINQSKLNLFSSLADARCASFNFHAPSTMPEAMQLNWLTNICLWFYRLGDRDFDRDRCLPSRILCHSKGLSHSLEVGSLWRALNAGGFSKFRAQLDRMALNEVVNCEMKVVVVVAVRDAPAIWYAQQVWMPSTMNNIPLTISTAEIYGLCGIWMVFVAMHSHREALKKRWVE